jgi:hypothetical protein
MKTEGITNKDRIPSELNNFSVQQITGLKAPANSKDAPNKVNYATPVFLEEPLLPKLPRDFIVVS